MACSGVDTDIGIVYVSSMAPQGDPPIRSSRMLDAGPVYCKPETKTIRLIEVWGMGCVLGLSLMF